MGGPINANIASTSTINTLSFSCEKPRLGTDKIQGIVSLLTWHASLKDKIHGIVTVNNCLIIYQLKSYVKKRKRTLKKKLENNGGKWKYIIIE